jgi:hypothetical protein
MRHHPLISLDKRERANHVQHNISIDCQLTQRHRQAPRPKLPLDLFYHLCSCAAVLLLLLCPLFGDESSSTCMRLSVYGPVLPLILPRNLLLMRRFLRLPGRRWKSGHPGCRQDRDSHRNWSYRCESALPTFAVVDRASSDDAATGSGRGVSLGVFFWDSRRTCWTRI